MEIVHKVADILHRLQRCNIDIRIDKNDFCAWRMQSAFDCLNGGRTRKDADRFYSSDATVSQKTREGFDSRLRMAEFIISGVEKHAHRVEQEYDTIVDEADGNVRANYFFNNYERALLF